ncbi:hypothetical protein ACQPYK_23140 [Streptosporangium sp. CA-135522]|uniref:hypothetical protein n=1 Tax=Streptosporangium sp. CA-135522 TaxID=3240072 RepID=UPI003D91B12A
MRRSAGGPCASAAGADRCGSGWPPGEHDPAGRRIHDPDPSPYGDAPAEVADALHAEWIGHLTPQTLTAVRIEARALNDAHTRLDDAVRAAREDGRSWADIGAAVGISRQSAHERWAQPSRPARAFATGDRVRLLVAQHVSYLDEDLADEGEDAGVRFDVPSGTLARVVKVRPYPTPLPYVVLLEDGREFGVPEHDITRVASAEA